MNTNNENGLIKGLIFGDESEVIMNQPSINNGPIQVNVNPIFMNIVQQEEGLINDQNFRANNLSREDALYRVKYLATLPDGYLTSRMVAEYFEIPESTLRRNVDRNREELILNGMLILSGEELKEYKEKFDSDTMSLSKVNREIRLFNKRTVLNIAMLLRDSLVAKAIRYVILNVLETPEGQQLFYNEVIRLENELKEYKTRVNNLEEELNAYKKNTELELNNVKDTARTSLMSTKLIQEGMENVYRYNNKNNYDANDPNLIDAVDKIVSKRFEVNRAYPYNLM